VAVAVLTVGELPEARVELEDEAVAVVVDPEMVEEAADPSIELITEVTKSDATTPKSVTYWEMKDAALVGRVAEQKLEISVEYWERVGASLLLLLALRRQSRQLGLVSLLGTCQEGHERPTQRCWRGSCLLRRRRSSSWLH
jgi:hypothetical protein